MANSVSKETISTDYRLKAAGLSKRKADKKIYKYSQALLKSYEGIRKEEAKRDKGKLYHCEWMNSGDIAFSGDLGVMLGLMLGIFFGQLLMPAFNLITGYNKMYTYIFVLLTGVVMAYGMIFPGIYGRHELINRRIKYNLPTASNIGTTTIYWLHLPSYKDKNGALRPITVSGKWKLQSPLMFISGIVSILLELFVVIAVTGFVLGAYEKGSELAKSFESGAVWESVKGFFSSVLGPSLKAGLDNIIPTIGKVAGIIFSMKAVAVLLIMALVFWIGYIIAASVPYLGLSDGRNIGSLFSDRCSKPAITIPLVLIFLILGYIFLKSVSRGGLENIGYWVLHFMGIETPSY